MKPENIHFGRTAPLLLSLLLLPLAARAADEVVIFGLLHKSINSADLSVLDSGSGLHVDDLSVLATKVSPSVWGGRVGPVLLAAGERISQRQQLHARECVWPHRWGGPAD